jgi:hypothetical protein
VLAITGGAPRRIALRITPPDGALAFKAKQLCVGPVAVRTPVNATADLVNKGHTDTSFRVTDAPGMACMPAQGVVPAGDTLPLGLTFTCADAQRFSSVLQIERRGGGAVKLPITAEPTQPDVAILEGEFDFGKVYQGGSKRLPLTLVNRSPVPATATLNLREHEAFRLAIAKEEWSAAEYTHCPLTSNRRMGSSGLRASRVAGRCAFWSACIYLPLPPSSNSQSACLDCSPVAQTGLWRLAWWSYNNGVL